MMDKGTEHAYKWAKGQNYQSVAADYARALAIEIDRLNTELLRVTQELEVAKEDIAQECGTCKFVGRPTIFPPCDKCGWYHEQYLGTYGWEWRGLVPANTQTGGETGDEARGGGEG